ncbi:MAG: hypothetical protein NZ853_06120 [Leptospiraceae bacterium]|nr:hypothetical protein [Leptospiraceae bacterium]MDW7976473.1 hypothetical protein [Leptospiraceae bacterium]
MKLSQRKFEKQLIRFIDFRGIDISVQLEDGSIVNLNKNRKFEKGYIINITKTGEEKIPIKSIKKAEFYILE